jgi:hypothetical protein
MQKFFYNQALFRIVWPPVYGAFIYLLILLLNNNLDQLNDSFFGQELYFIIILSYLVFEFIRFTGNYFLRKQHFEPRSLDVVYLVFASLAITTILVTVGVFVYFRYILGFSSWNIFSAELSTFLSVFAFSTLFYTAITISTSFLYRENRDQMQQEKILKDNLELELMKFKNEVNPDLLYDSLESLITLIHKSPEESEDYIDRIAQVYRYILSSRNSELVEIQEELKAVNNLITLLNEKHQNSISLHQDVSNNNLETLVIPGALVSVVESIVRNTIVSDHQPLNINIDDGDQDGYLTVSHKLNDRLRPGMEDGNGQLQRAYSVFTEKPVVSVKAYGENFIKIPLLQLEEELTA